MLDFQMLLRFNFQPCNLAKPFTEMVVGFYVHSDMNFVVTERKEDSSDVFTQLNGGSHIEVAALPGAYDE